MKAAQLKEYGEKEAVNIVDIPEPSPAEGKILVEVHAAGINPVDWKIQLGYLKDYMPLELPVILGGDFAGVVVNAGESTEFNKGDEVFGQASALAKSSGSFAEFALTSPSTVAAKPKNLNFVEAGSLPLVGASALQGITEHIKLEKGQKILIHGGAGGIGSIAIQVAKNIGAHVATTVSTNDMEYAKGLGADEVIDYKTQKFEDLIREYDAVFDTVGGEVANKSIAVLKKGGVLVSMAGQVDEELAKASEIAAINQMSRVTTERLNALTKLVESGVVTVHVEKTFPLTETAEALDYLKNSPPQGKVVIVIK